MYYEIKMLSDTLAIARAEFQAQSSTLAGEGRLTADLNRCFTVLDALLTGAIADIDVQWLDQTADQLLPKIARSSLVRNLADVFHDLINSAHGQSSSKSARWVVDMWDTFGVDAQGAWDQCVEFEEPMIHMLALLAASTDVFGNLVEVDKGFEGEVLGHPIVTEDGYPSWQLIAAIVQGLPSALSVSFE